MTRQFPHENSSIGEHLDSITKIPKWQGFKLDF
jgi:hypothetical protein